MPASDRSSASDSASTDTAVVTRFAPSPTGLLHVGNLRAALLSWLAARKAGGTFILRIDDTDAERSREEYVEAAKRELTWLGLEWDRYERQSERMERYDALAARWREEGLLYACYETPTELELKRKRQLSMGKPPVYDRAALALTDAEKAALEAEGRRPHWRFKLRQERVSWPDAIRGETIVDCASVSDPVLIRADGGYLYTICSVLDDAEMGVTDVIRGEDHVTNTATQIQMFEAIGAAPPRFAHHSLLVGASGEALGKRLGSLSLNGLREDGIEALTLLSHMARLGTADPVVPRTALADVVGGFDITRFGRAPARFDPEELTLLNMKLLAETPYPAVAERLRAMGAPDDAAEALWRVIRGNLGRLEDAADWITITSEGALSAADPGDAAFVDEALTLLPPRPWTEETWGVWTGAVREKTGRKGKALFMPLRLALTGQARGPEMAQLLPLMRRIPGHD